MSAIKRQILPKILTLCSKKVSALANKCYKSVHYIEFFPWDFDCDSAGSLKKCPLLLGVGYIAYLTGWTVFPSHLFSSWFFGLCYNWDVTQKQAWSKPLFPGTCNIPGYCLFF